LISRRETLGGFNSLNSTKRKLFPYISKQTWNISNEWCVCVGVGGGVKENNIMLVATLLKRPEKINRNYCKCHYIEHCSGEFLYDSILTHLTVLQLSRNHNNIRQSSKAWQLFKALSYSCFHLQLWTWRPSLCNVELRTNPAWPHLNLISY
jgi:hypothetical protein